MRGPAGEGVGSGNSGEVFESNLSTTTISGKRPPKTEARTPSEGIGTSANGISGREGSNQEING